MSDETSGAVVADAPSDPVKDLEGMKEVLDKMRKELADAKSAFAQAQADYGKLMAEAIVWRDAFKAAARVAIGL